MQIIRVLLMAVFLIANCFNVKAVDLCVHDVDARSLVETLSRTYCVNVIGTEKIKGNIDINVENKSPKEIIEQIVREKGFYFIADKNTYSIENNDEKSQLDIAILEPKEISAEEVKKALEVIYPKDKIHLASESNQILVYGNKVQEKLARDVLAKIDTPVKQVNVEVCVVAVQKNKTKEQGVNWEWENNKIPGNITFKKALKSPFKMAGQGNLLLSDNKSAATIIARPNIVARNSAQARILIGDRVPVIVEHERGGEVRNSVEYEEAGISLLYTPHITKDGTIDTTVKAAVSTPHLVPEIKAYRITTREAQTRVNLRDGEMLVIGGLMDRRKEDIEHKIPVLGDIPILGKLFSHKIKNEADVELFIVLRGTIEK